MVLKKKKYILNDSNYMTFWTFWKRQNYENNKNNSGGQGLGEGGKALSFPLYCQVQPSMNQLLIGLSYGTQFPRENSQVGLSSSPPLPPHLEGLPTCAVHTLAHPTPGALSPFTCLSPTVLGFRVLPLPLFLFP